MNDLTEASSEELALRYRAYTCPNAAVARECHRRAEEMRIKREEEVEGVRRNDERMRAEIAKADSLK